MLGLLDKARKLRDSLGLATDGREEFAFDPDSASPVKSRRRSGRK